VNVPESHIPSASLKNWNFFFESKVALSKLIEKSILYAPDSELLLIAAVPSSIFTTLGLISKSVIWKKLSSGLTI
jgi:hypothetical protein